MVNIMCLFSISKDCFGKPREEIDEADMVAQDLLASSLFSRLQSIGDTDTKGERKYAANALTQIRRVQAAAAASEPVIIVEDDLLAAAPADAVAQHLCQALRCTAYSKVSLGSASYTRYTSCSTSLSDAQVHRILKKSLTFFSETQ